MNRVQQTNKRPESSRNGIQPDSNVSYAQLLRRSNDPRPKPKVENNWRAQNNPVNTDLKQNTFSDSLNGRNDRMKQKQNFSVKAAERPDGRTTSNNQRKFVDMSLKDIPLPKQLKELSIADKPVQSVPPQTTFNDPSILTAVALKIGNGNDSTNALKQLLGITTESAPKTVPLAPPMASESKSIDLNHLFGKSDPNQFNKVQANLLPKPPSNWHNKKELNAANQLPTGAPVMGSMVGPMGGPMCQVPPNRNLPPFTHQMNAPPMQPMQLLQGPIPTAPMAVSIQGHPVQSMHIQPRPILNIPRQIHPPFMNSNMPIVQRHVVPHSGAPFTYPHARMGSSIVANFSHHSQHPSMLPGQHQINRQGPIGPQNLSNNSKHFPGHGAFIPLQAIRKNAKSKNNDVQVQQPQSKYNSNREISTEQKYMQVNDIQPQINEVRGQIAKEPLQREAEIKGSKQIESVSIAALVPI